ncbi:phosphatase PAP2 family protein [Treponema phagedenis]|uniref:PAP2 family protein n=1 Tax=Treponema phagedenis TaxID=162 RepID=A0A0B7GUI6_TREPH|nr:phosphatase PAP2 family protein [Treponema phagedenis]NVP23384.1 phosphatase PAP2 family protein [Treponema phagedenis]QEJ95604.1 phosphatase PAP2 family protein [Treponema phagedenis]QEJ98526.1 phosphatase PAP2 family protein [Treponema phagedenis]QEK01457.1 phosphatase PAP2 family protein [Treponema phagedenis]QEK04033.1 phosphatase PAP2 family protein [Treponema phagedenis]
MEYFETVESAVHPVLLWGIEVIKTVQFIANPILTKITSILSFLGGEGIVLFALFFIWCIEYRKGLIIFLSLAISNGINSYLKNLFKVPRPFVVDPSVKLEFEKNFSTPSGHSQSSVVFWALLFFYHDESSEKTETKESPTHKKLKAVFMFLIPLYIGFTRVYLGVHYPTDVLFGWVIGAVLSVIALFLLPKILTAVTAFFASAKKISNRRLRGLELAVFALIAVLFVAFDSDPSMGGAVLGLAIGKIFLFDSYAAEFSAASGSVFQKILRYLVGLVLCVGGLLVLKQCFSFAPEEYTRLLRFLRYAIAAALVSGAAPILFLKLRLA